MLTPRGRVLLGLLILVALGVAMSLALDFQVAESNSDTSASVSKLAAGQPAGGGAASPGAILLYVGGDDDFRADVEKELTRWLGSVPGIAGVSALDSMPTDTARPTLVVEPRRDSLTWTPAYASASLSTRLYYASDGDMSWRADAAVVMGRPDGGPQVRVRGDLALKDTTRGVVSWVAYRRHLARQIASSVSDALRGQVYEEGRATSG